MVPALYPTNPPRLLFLPLSRLPSADDCCITPSFLPTNPPVLFPPAETLTFADEPTTVAPSVFRPTSPPVCLDPLTDPATTDDSIEP
jgi:hypothetical protein